MMATALNMSFKVPVGYFLLPDAFTSEKRAELLRNCIYHVNATGVVVTNLVMDNCPVNYATFRRLYHLYFGTGKIYKFYIKNFSCNKNIQSGFVKAKINLTILWHSLFNLDHFKVAVPQVFWHSILWN